MTRLAAAATVALTLMFVGAEAAQACSCAPIDARTALKQADGAFVGRLLAVRVVDPPAQGEPTSSGDPTDYIYRVGGVYKGGPGLHRGRRVRVRSVRDSATCGLPRRRGRLYGLFLTRRDGRWHSNACSVVTRAEMRAAANSASRSRHTPAGSPGSAACG
jgi:hypothetical protein